MKSWFIGTVSLKFSTKLRKNYLDGKQHTLPFIGFESNDKKNLYPMALNFNKTLWMHTHKPEGSEEKEVIPEVVIKQWVSWGWLKLKISVKTGTRYLEGWLGGSPVKGWEDRSIKNKFYLVIDEKRMAYFRSKNPNGADKAEVVSQ